MCHIILVVPLFALALFAFLPVSQALMLYLPVLLSLVRDFLLGHLERCAPAGDVRG